MSITPLCKQISTLQIYQSPTKLRNKYESPAVFATALKPLYPEAGGTTVKRFLRQKPPRLHPDLLAWFRVRKFEYAPKSRFLGRVNFKDIPQTKKLPSKPKLLQPLSNDQETRHILDQPEFLDALDKHKSKKAFKQRRHHSKVVPRRHSEPFDPVEFDRPNRKVKRRSVPFNEDTEMDPFMLFHDLQAPNSALKSDSVAYVKQTEEVAAAKEERYRARAGSPLKYDQLVDLIHLTFNMGIYASPPKVSTTPSPKIDKRSFRPMDIDPTTPSRPIDKRSFRPMDID